MRKPIIAGNWKMNNTPAQAEELVNALIPLVKDAACDVVVCPPFTALAAVSKLIEGTNIALGAQNIHWAPKGAFTGEISADMLKALNVSYAIIGHSERRQYFGETDASVNCRLKAALEAGITPIVCVGESLEQRESGVTGKIVSGQTVAACESNYRQALANYGLIGAGQANISSGDSRTQDGIIAEIRTAVINCDTHFYVRLENSVGYLDFNAAEVPRAVLLDKGDRIWYDYVLDSAEFPENGIVPATGFRFEGEEPAA